MGRKRTPPFSRDEDRWQALLDRNPEADRAFVYSVRSTGVYCRPTCPAKLARRESPVPRDLRRRPASGVSGMQAVHTERGEPQPTPSGCRRLRVSSDG